MGGLVFGGHECERLKLDSKFYGSLFDIKYVYTLKWIVSSKRGTLLT